MSRKFGYALAILLVSAAPALADVGTCGEEPVPPALPSASDIAAQAPADAAAAKHQGFLDVKAWQKSLKSYRDCLNATVAADKRDIAAAKASGDKKAADKVAALEADGESANTRYNHSVETEKSVVGDYVAMSNAYCSRSDVDQSTCPKKK